MIEMTFSMRSEWVLSRFDPAKLSNITSVESIRDVKDLESRVCYTRFLFSFPSVELRAPSAC